MMTPAQCRAARAIIDWSQQDLADEAKVGNATIRNFESGRTTPQHSTLQVLRAALEAAGVIFVAENGEGPGVRLRKAPAAQAPSETQIQASAAEVRSQAAAVVDEALSEVDATRQEKADRRGALIDEPAVIETARGSGRARP